MRGTAQGLWRRAVRQNQLEHRTNGTDSALAAELNCHDADGGSRPLIYRAFDKYRIKTPSINIWIKLLNVGKRAERGGAHAGIAFA